MKGLINMKTELKAVLEVIEEKINNEKDNLEQIYSIFPCDDISYNYHLGKLGGLREIKSMVKDLLDE